MSPETLAWMKGEITKSQLEGKVVKVEARNRRMVRANIKGENKS